VDGFFAGLTEPAMRFREFDARLGSLDNQSFRARSRVWPLLAGRPDPALAWRKDQKWRTTILSPKRLKR
jgi:hypothetical protein